jgi:hypothetical protein
MITCVFAKEEEEEEAAAAEETTNFSLHHSPMTYVQ